MKYKKIMLMLITAIFLVSIAGVCASDANDMLVASEDNLEIDKTTDDTIGVGEDTDLASSDENEILTEGEQTFANLNTTINGNTDHDIYLDCDYKYSSGDDSFKNGIVIERDVNIYGNGHTINGSNQARIFKINNGNVVFHNITFTNGNDTAGDGGAINGGCKAINCTFKENHAARDGGAMVGRSSAVNCTFSGNSASHLGGAMCGGSAVNCTFSGNTAEWDGGAMFYCSAVNCTFSGNSASHLGGAMCGGSAVNCTFSGNSAEMGGGAMDGGSAVNCTFSGNTAKIGGGAMLNVYYLYCYGQEGEYIYCEELDLFFDVKDFTSTYNSNKAFSISLINQPREDVMFINVGVVIFKDGVVVRSYSCLSGDRLIFDLTAGNYTAELKITYPNLDPQPKNIAITINKATPKIEVTAKESTYPNAIVNVKTDVSGEYMVTVGDKTQIVTLEANVAKDITFTGLAVNETGYAVNVTNMDIENCTKVFNDTAKAILHKATPTITAAGITATYNINKNLVITLTDSNGNPLVGEKITVSLKGAKNYITDKNGQVKVSTKGLVPKTYAATITFAGNNNYVKSTASAKVTVTKATPKLTAKAKTFKKSVKTKKYTITLKDNQNKAMKKAKVTLKIKGKKAITVKTNAKGKATFKIKKLTKKGTYKATVTYKGNKCYNKVNKKVKIKVK